MTRLEWLKRRWAFASPAKKYVAIAGFTILGIAALVAFVLLGTSLPPRVLGFGFFGTVVLTLIAIVAVAIRESRNFPRRIDPFRRYPAGDASMSTAKWSADRDKQMLSREPSHASK